MKKEMKKAMIKTLRNKGILFKMTRINIYSIYLTAHIIIIKTL